MTDTMNLLRSTAVTLTNGTETTIDALLGDSAKALLVVNVASKCGFTPQYAGLEKIWREEKDNGLVIVGLPCDQFLKQEFGNDSDISEFCTVNYGVTFPILQRGKVRGRGKHALFDQLLDAKDDKGRGGLVLWNFEKFLVNLETGALRRFRSTVEPESPEFTGAVRELLAAS